MEKIKILICVIFLCLCFIHAVGNMLHLIVEACIARNLIDTSAYFWSGYVVPSTLSKDATSYQDSPWLTFLEGTPPTGSLRNSLMVTPASRYCHAPNISSSINFISNKDSFWALLGRPNMSWHFQSSNV